MPLHDPILDVLAACWPLFPAPAWRKLMMLTGTLLARGRSAVAAAFPAPGKEREPNFSTFHQVRKRERWSPSAVSRQLQCLIVGTFVEASCRLELVIDEAQERRREPTISKRGHGRESALESRVQSVSSPGLRRVVMAAIVTLPWTKQRGAQSFVWVLAPTPEVSAQWADQMVSVVCQRFPTLSIILLGTTASSILARGLHLQAQRTTLLTLFHLHAALHTLQPERDAHTIGPPRVVSQLLPSLELVIADPTTTWQVLAVDWYEPAECRLEICMGTALWDRAGFALLPVRWVFICDPVEKRPPQVLFSMNQELTVGQIMRLFLKRWGLETAFEESRAHLRIETHCQWPGLAIEQATALLVLFGCALHLNGGILFAQTAWSCTHAAAFREVLAIVRRHFWGNISVPHRPTILLWFSFLMGLSTTLPGLPVTMKYCTSPPVPAAHYYR